MNKNRLPRGKPFKGKAPVERNSTKQLLGKNIWNRLSYKERAQYLPASTRLSDSDSFLGKFGNFGLGNLDNI